MLEIRRFAKLFPVCLLAASLLFLPACSDDDDDGGMGPGGGNGGGDLPDDGSPGQVIGESALQTMEIAGQIAGQLPAWTDGADPSRRTEPVWDAENQWWTWTEEEVIASDFTIPQHFESRNWIFRVQYLDGGLQPQMSPDGAVAIAAEIELLYSLSKFASENSNRTMSLDLFHNVEITGLQQETQNVQIDGSGELFAEFTINGEYSEFYSDLVSTHMDFDITPPGCPTNGQGDFTVATTIMEWTYQGGPDVDWSVWSNGQQVATGTFALDCGN